MGEGQPDVTTDEDLCRAALAGEEDAFRELVLRYQDGICGWAAQFLGEHRAEAEDVAQEVFLAVHRGLPRFRFDSAFRTWLYSVARHVMLNHRRGLLRSMAGRWRSLWEDEDEMDVPDGRPELIEALEKGEEQELLRRAMGRLSETSRTVLSLRDGEGLSYEEIARVMGVPLGTVRSRLHNATASLVKAFEEEYDGA